MPRTLHKIALALWLVMLGSVAAFAQDEESDKGFLTGLLEDSLGGEGRVVRIDGFTGALRSTARMERITIADPEGVWIEMTDLTMQWNRSALFRGAIEILELSAGEVNFLRLPQTLESEGVAPEARDFSLPDIPVSIDIQKFEIERFSLATVVLGQEADVRVAASLFLGDGDFLTDFEAVRVDGKQGRFDVDVAVRQSIEEVSVSIDLQEEADGIAANALNIRGKPEVTLSVEGDGTFQSLSTRIRLAADGQDRLTGRVDLAEPSDGPGPEIAVDLRGDLAPLFSQKYAALFGEQSVLSARAAPRPDGGFDVRVFDLDSGATQLAGSLRVSDGNWPEAVQLEGSLATQDGSRLNLPIGAKGFSVQTVALDVRYDADIGETWNAEFTVTDMLGAGFGAQDAQIKAVGTLREQGGAQVELDSRIEFNGAGLSFEDAALFKAVGDNVQGRFQVVYTSDAPVRISDLELTGADYALRGDATIAGLDADFETQVDVALTADDISRFSALAGTNLAGTVDVGLRGTLTAGGAFDLRIDGQGGDLATGIARADPLLQGQTDLDLRVQRNKRGTRLPAFDLKNAQFAVTGNAELTSAESFAQVDAQIFDSALIDPSLEGPIKLQGDVRNSNDVWSVKLDGIGPHDTTIEVEGPVTGPAPRVEFAAFVPQTGAFVPQIEGQARLTGTLRLLAEGWQVDSQISGPLGVSGTVAGQVTGPQALDLQYDLTMEDVARIAPDFNGPVTAAGRLTQVDAGMLIATQINGPLGFAGSVEGRVTGQNAPDVSFQGRLPDIAPLAPGFRGVAEAEGRLSAGEDGLRLEATVGGPYGATARVFGQVTGPDPRMAFEARVPDVGAFGVGLRGPLVATGTAQPAGDGWQINTDVTGPAQSSAQIIGTVNGADLDLSARGALPLGLLAPVVAPRSIQGIAQMDLRIDGPPQLSSVSGTVQTTDARFADPSLFLALEGINSQITLQNEQARVAISGTVASGGRVQINGAVDLTGSLNADLTTRFEAVRLVDPRLYEITTSGQVRVNGPLNGGALISGQVNVTQADIQVPNSQYSGFEIVPQIVHRNAPAGVRRTLARADLDAGSGSGPASTRRSLPFRLDLVVNAPARIFVRGRGLDAELGGSLQLTGDTRDVISTGSFELIRGRLDVLGKRFELDEGRVLLQGDLDPYLEFVARTETEEGSASVIIEGRASEPNVRFDSTPPGPEDEVLAQIFFGRSTAQLTPFQALQLANAVATLTGGGSGLVSELRLQFNLDDLDVTSDAEGNVGLRLGKYLSDNVYTDILIGDRDDAGVSLNIDLTKKVTVRGSVQSDGGSSIGVFFEHDY